MLSIHELPALRMLIPFIMGVLCALNNFVTYTSIHYLFFIWIGLCAFVLSINNYKNLKHLTSIGVIIITYFIGVILGLLSIPGKTSVHLINQNITDKYVTLIGKIDEPPVTRNFTQLVVNVSHILDSTNHWNDGKGRVLIYLKDICPYNVPNPGDLIQFNVKLAKIQQPKNPHAFDYAKYLWTKHILLSGFIEAKDMSKIQNASKFDVYAFSYKLRNNIMDRVYELMGNNEQADLTCGLLLGYRDKIDPETEKIFIETGSVHLLAVSGMHVILIYSNILTLLNVFRIKKYLGNTCTSLFAILIIWLFSFVVGLAASIVRATVMITLLVLGDIFKKYTHSFNLVCIGAILIILHDGMAVFDVGFQLSFAAVCGIIHLQRPIAQRLPLIIQKNYTLTSLIAVTIAAQIGTLPLILYYFNQFPVYFLISGIVAVFISDYLIKLGGILLLISMVSMGLASYFSLLWHGLTSALIYSVESISRIPLGLIEMIFFNQWMALCLAMMIILLMIHQYKPIYRLKMSIITLLAIILIIDIYSLHAFRKNDAITVYHHNKGRIMSIKKGFSSLLLVDSTVGVKGVMDVAQKDLIHSNIKEIDIEFINSNTTKYIPFKNYMIVWANQLNYTPLNNNEIVYLPKGKFNKEGLNHTYLTYQYSDKDALLDTHHIKNIKDGYIQIEYDDKENVTIFKQNFSAK